MLLGIDAGNYQTKACSQYGVNCFMSDIGEYRERNLKDKFTDEDIVFEYKGEKGFAGTLAIFESEFSGTMKSLSKANNDVVLRVLISLHLYGSNHNNIVVGQPIESHNEEEKNKLKTMLKGNHEITVNEVKKKITINRVEVAPEGSAAILSNPKNGLVRIIDIGSGTTNYATLINLRRVDKDSFTKLVGTETTKNKDGQEMAKNIYRTISATWNKDDEIYLTGGGAVKVYDHLKQYLNNVHVLKPRLGNTLIEGKYSNVIGFYNIAKGLYDHD